MATAHDNGRCEDNTGRYDVFECCLRGRRLRVGDEGYDAARPIHNAEYDRHPAMIVQAADVADVVATVNFARDNGLTLAVRSGGHSVGGQGTSDDMVLDLSGMKSVSIDAASRRVEVEAGATWGEVAWAAQSAGLALSSGDTGSVGVGGLTTGGGIGWMVRKYGLTIDRLRSAQVVTADGRLVTASSTEHPDLFWAIRGGGGNFGVVTSFVFEACAVGTVLGGAVVYDAAEGATILRRYADYAAAAPDELTTISFIMNAPPAPFIPPSMVGKLVIIVGVCYAGDLDEGARVVAPLRELATPVADLIAPMPYPAMFALTKEAETKGHHADVRSMFMHDLDDTAIDTILRQLSTMSSPSAMGQIRVLGGAMARVSTDATAFAHRDKQYMFTAINTWLEPRDSEREHAWSERFWQAMRRHADGVYANFLGNEGDERVHEAYPPETYRRLAAIKDRYDRSNFFHLNQNIKPTSTASGEELAA